MSTRTPSLEVFVGDLALAWQRLVLYQPGHPSRAAAVEGPLRVLTALLAPVGEVALGVARDALVSAEERVTTPAGRKLAAALYQAGVGVLRFREGVTAAEIETFLQNLPRHAGWTAPRPLWDELAAAGARHLVLEPLDFSQVRATESLDDPAAGEMASESLWDQILRRLMVDAHFGAAAREAAPVSSSLAEVVRVLQQVAARHGAVSASEPGGAASGDALSALGAAVASVLTGHLQERPEGAARRSTLQHLGDLLAAIPEGLRERLLDAAIGQLMAGEERAEDLDAFAGSVSAAQMVSSLRRLRSQQVVFSARAQALVEELALEAAPTFAPAETDPDPERLAEELRRLFADDDVDRAGHGEGDRLVLELPRPVSPPAPSRELDDRLETLVDDRQLAAVASALLELLQSPVLGPAELAGVARRIESVFRGLLLAGRLRAAVNVVERLRAIHLSGEAGEAVREATEHCLAGMRQREAITTLLTALLEVPDDARPVLQRLMGLLGPEMVPRLLLALGEEEDLGRRRHTFDLLVGLGATMVPHALSLLGDPRWFVVRNMLSLLRHTGVRLPLASLQESLLHTDERVRAEAVRCLAVAATPPPADLLERLIADDDERVAETAVALIGGSRLSTGREPLLALLRRPDPLGRHRALRLKALHALGELGDARALAELRPFFRQWLPVGSSDERRAAFASLARYPPAARLPLLQQGLRNRDPEVRSLCQQLLAATSSPAEGV
jgi:hypothetical protein